MIKEIYVKYEDRIKNRKKYRDTHSSSVGLSQEGIDPKEYRGNIRKNKKIKKHYASLILQSLL